MTLILLHPLPLDGSIWPDELLAFPGRVFAPTLYRFGDSLEDWARGVLDEVGDGPLDLVGNSIGGSCAVEIAALARDRVRSIVLVGAKPGHRPEPASLDEALQVLEHEGTAGAWTRYWAPLFAPDADPRTVERARSIAESLPAGHLTSGVRAFHSRADRAALARDLDIPIAIVRGEHDPIPRNPWALAASLRHGVFHRIASAGHYIPIERPDDFVDYVRELSRWCGRP